MSHKVCLITGASAGIGKATASALAGQGFEIVLVSRDKGRGEAAADEIRRTNKGATIDVLVADLGSRSDVRRLAANFSGARDRLDVLINNAGIFHRGRDRSVTIDGYEVHFAINHLGHFLLTNLLLDQLRAAPQGRVVTVSSGRHSEGVIDFDDLQGERKYDGSEAYANSKLANLLFSYELARRLTGSRITANCVYPGVVATDLIINNLPGSMRWLPKMILANPRQGSAASVYAATLPELDAVSGMYYGKYFGKVRRSKSSKDSHDAEVAARLWQVSGELTGINAI